MQIRDLRLELHVYKAYTGRLHISQIYKESQAG